jgi:Arc/MetJ family transcription regulator
VYSQYQEETSKRLESQWIKSLRAKTEIKIDEETLSKAFRFIEPKTSTPANANATAALDLKN